MNKKGKYMKRTKKEIIKKNKRKGNEGQKV